MFVPGRPICIDAVAASAGGLLLLRGSLLSERGKVSLPARTPPRRQCSYRTSERYPSEQFWKEFEKDAPAEIVAYDLAERRLFARKPTTISRVTAGLVLSPHDKYSVIWGGSPAMIEVRSLPTLKLTGSFRFETAWFQRRPFPTRNGTLVALGYSFP